MWTHAAAYGQHRYTEETHGEKETIGKAAAAFDALNHSVEQRRRLKTVERNILFARVDGLTREQTAALSDLEYHLNFLTPGPNGLLSERVLLVFCDVALVLAPLPAKAGYRLTDTIPLASASVAALEDTEVVDNALQLGSVVVSAVSAAERNSALAALQAAIDDARKREREADQPAPAPTPTPTPAPAQPQPQPQAHAQANPQQLAGGDLTALVLSLQRTVAELRRDLDAEVAQRQALERRLSSILNH